MPWCPKCRLEYREGITVCADCNSPLVAESELAEEKQELCSYESREVLEQMNEFFQFSDVKSGEIVYHEEEGLWYLKVAASDQKKAEKLYHGFMLGEMDRKKELEEHVLPEEEHLKGSECAAAEEAVEESQSGPLDAAQEYLKERILLNEKNASLHSKEHASYVKQEERYRDYNSTGYTFLMIGIAGFVVMLLSWMQVLKIFHGNLIAQVVFSIISVGCIIIGIQSIGKARYLKKDIGNEKALEERILSWLSGNINQEELEAVGREDSSEEVNYLNQIAYIKEQLMEEFKDENEDYLDQLIDEYYDTRIKKS